MSEVRVLFPLSAGLPPQETAVSIRSCNKNNAATMRLAILLSLAIALTGVGPSYAQHPPLPESDRIRLAEAIRLAEGISDYIWPGWSEIQMAVLLVTPDHEYLIRHPRPSDDFVEIVKYDSLLQSTILIRDRQNSPSLMATFPAVGGFPTIVVGQPEQTGFSSTFLQNGRP